jgi:hypothetical protein
LLDDEADQSKKLLEPDVMIVKPRPITAKIQTTMMHLRAKAGYWSRFRGMSLFLIYSFARSTIIHFLMASTVFPYGPRRFVAHFIAEVFLCRFEMTWVHIAISEPSKLPWYKRVPRGWKPFKNIVPAAALKSAATQLVVALSAIYACHSKLRNSHANTVDGISPEDARAILLDAMIILVIYVNMALLIEIPATVTFVRVAASMLPEHDEAIVPFDRSFGGKVVPEIVGGSGKIGLMDAWRTFDRSSRMRLLKLIAKVVAIQIAVTFLFMGVMVGELKVMMGDDFDKMVAQGKMLIKH